MVVATWLLATGCGQVGYSFVERDVGADVRAGSDAGDAALEDVVQGDVAIDAAVPDASLDARDADLDAAGCRCRENETLLALAPLVYYRLGETSGTLINDFSGNDRHALLVTDGGRVEYDAENDTLCGSDGAMRFLGNHTAVIGTHEGAYIEHPESLLTKEPDDLSIFTVSVWYRFEASESPTGAFPERARVVSIGSANSDQIAFFHDVYTIAVPFTWANRQFRGSGVYNNFTYPNPLPANRWHHVVATNDGVRTTIYLDGAAAAVGDSWAWSGQQWQDTTLTIAASGRNYSDRHGGRFRGWIDEVAVWDQALTDGEVAQIYDEAVNEVCVD